jgi:hypothetical protein
MKIYSINVKRTIIGLTSVSCLALLSACSLSSIKNPFSSERPQQMVTGDRHAPVLNASRVDTFVAPVQSMPVPTLAKPDVAAATPVRELKKRKPVAGNTVSKGNTKTVYNFVPVNKPVVVDKNIVQENAPTLLAQSTTGDAKEVKTEVASTSSWQNFFTANTTNASAGSAAPWKMREPFSAGVKHRELAKEAVQSASDVVENTEVVEAKMDEASVDAPKLSSVPPTPSEFRDVKKTSKDQLKTLQSDHKNAQKNKQLLDAEPSQSQSKSDVEKEVSPVDAVQKVEAPVADGSPRRGVDIMTQDEWNALLKQRQEDIMSEPEEEGNTAKPQSFLAPEGDPSIVQLALAQATEQEVIALARSSAKSTMSDATPDAIFPAPSADTYGANPDSKPVINSGEVKIEKLMPESRYTARNKAVRTRTLPE